MTALPSTPLIERAKAVGRMLESTLIVAADEGFRPFLGLAFFLWAKLSPEERQDLARAALMACNDDEAQEAAEAVLGSPKGAGWPQAPFDGVMDEALFWADIASPEEHEAYALVCLAHLSPERRLEIWRAVEGRAAA